MELTIQKHPNAKYVSFEQQLRFDAEKYIARAQSYINVGKLDRAIGCLNKAVRKINRANLLKMSPLEEAIFGPIIKAMSIEIVEKIINGS